MTGVLGLAFILVFVALERLPRMRFRKSRLFRKAFMTDIAYVLTGYLPAVLALRWFAGSHEIRATSWDALGAFAYWIQFGIAIVILDLGNYVTHYVLHRSDRLWEIHKIHHSSPTLDWLATFRSHIAEQALRISGAPVLLLFLGLDPQIVANTSFLFLMWAVFIHSNIRIKSEFLEVVFITPRLHRIHHIYRTSEKNLGTMFTFWDRIRGTFAASIKDLKEVQFGNGANHYPQDWIHQFGAPLALRVSEHRGDRRRDRSEWRGEPGNTWRASLQLQVRALR